MIDLKRRKAADPVQPSHNSAAPAPIIAMPVELMTVRQAASYAQASQPTIRRWMRSDGLAAYRSRGRVRIDKADLVKFLKGETA